MENNPALHVLDQFSIEKKTHRLKAVQQGFINDTFLVFEGEEPLYILQRINTTVFGNVDGIMNNVHLALGYLKDEDYQAISLIKSNSGDPYFKTEDSCWRLMTFIDDSIAYDNTTNAEIAFEAGRIIGKFHLLLQDVAIDKFVDTIPDFHSLSLRAKQFEEAFQQADPKRKEKASKAIQFVEDSLAMLKQWDTEDLPERICHNDTKLNNILFARSTNKALCLIDLDTLMKGYFHYDFGDAIRTVANTAPEDEQDHQKITFEKHLFQAFVEGLAANGPFLTEKEKEVLPYGAILMPFLHGIRALTDYLNGNLYYRVAYEDQNLDRSLSLFDFTQKAMNEATSMKEIIQNSGL
ncbi:phosphotransferase enzyme family protein [Poritiphilus flavus]|uniref:Phosphotransferase n=1 Tax=Poritiphilus flavus TaxID=2697053 RepID=A0A6L9E714_9FLAO|nr:aminoglycoside phosphotransferase family protein [Poritiphilus flavus]NAS10506.1 phosphotransferase [Poritiphilus flavus]